MTLYAVPGPPDEPVAAVLDPEALLVAEPPVRHLRPVPEPDHDHDWRLVQVHFNDGASVREYSCGDCAAVWFA